MPFLRVVRDKRGYETTYLMHWYREGHRQRSRILYVFRTPGGVRVGREAFEPDVLRRIEAQHPDIQFDWSAVRENQQVVEASPDLRRRRPRRDEEANAEPAPVAAPAAPPPPKPSPAAPPAIPSTIQGATPDEQIAFLAEWYSIVRERLTQRIADPARLEMLLTLAERLNSTTWTDADQVTTGLQEAEQALERLSHVLAKRRRRARRKSRGPAAADAAAPADSDVASPSDAATAQSNDDPDDFDEGADS